MGMSEWEFYENEGCAGVCHYVPPRWNEIKWVAKQDTYHFVK